MLKLIVHPFVLALLANSSTHKHTRTHTRTHVCAAVWLQDIPQEEIDQELALLK